MLKQSVLLLTKYTTFFPQTLKKNKVLDTALDVRGIERRTAKSQLQVVMVCWGWQSTDGRSLQGNMTERVTIVSVGQLEPSLLGAENLVSIFQRKQPVSKSW